MSKIYWVKLFIQALPLFCINVILVLSGLFIVPIGLLFRYRDYSCPLDPNYPEWYMVKMPKLFHIWNNYEEGAIAKGEYNYLVGKDRKSFFYMWWWLATRNPANNLRTLPMFQLDMLAYDHAVYFGKNWFFTLSVHKETGKEKYSFRYRKPGKKGDFIVHIGFKAFPDVVNQCRMGMISPSDYLTRYRGFATQLIPSRS